MFNYKNNQHVVAHGLAIWSIILVYRWVDLCVLHNAKHSLFMFYNLIEKSRPNKKKIILRFMTGSFTLVTSAINPCFISKQDHGGFPKRLGQENIRQIVWTTFCSCSSAIMHDDVIKWKHFARYWPFVRGIHRSPVNSPHKDQWRGASMFSLICTPIKGGVNDDEAGDLRRYRTHYEITVMAL